MSATSYGYDVMLPGADLATARARVTDALKAEGFGVLTEIDVSATFAKKLDVRFRPYVILGACNPVLAHRALQAEPQIGLMLPCNVVLQAADGGTAVSIANPRAMFEMVDNAEMKPVAEEADARLRRVIDALG